MALLNLQTGQPENIAPEDELTALAQGTHMPLDGSKPLFNPEGKLVFAPANEAATKVQRYNYRVPTQEEFSNLAQQQKYGTPGQLAKTAAEGVARGATFGVSDIAESHLLGNASEALARKQANPGTAFGTELGGAVGSAFLAPELSPVGRLGKLGGLITRAAEAGEAGEGASAASQILAHAQNIGAKALGSGVEGAAFGLGENVSEAALGDPELTAQRAWANIGMGALLGGTVGAGAGAIEAGVPAIFGKAKSGVKNTWRKLFGGEIPEATPTLDDSAAMSDVDAPLGSKPPPPGTVENAQGAAIDQTVPSAPEQAASTPTEAAAPTTEAGAATQSDTTPSPTAAPELPTDAPQMPPPEAPATSLDALSTPNPLPGAAYEDGIIPKLIARGKEAFGGTPSEETLAGFRQRSGVKAGEILNPKERADFVRQSVDHIQQAYDLAEDAKRQGYTVAKPAEMKELLKGQNVFTAQSEGARIAQRVREVADMMEARPALYPARFPSKLRDVLQDYVSPLLHSESAGDVFNGIDNLKKMLDDRIPWNKETGGDAADAISALKSIRGEIKTSLENERIWGKAGARQASLNRATTDYLDSQKELQKRFMTSKMSRGKKVWSVEPKKVNEFFNMINDPRGEVRGNALAEHLKNTKTLIDELEKTHQTAGVPGFDPAGAHSTLSSVKEAMARAKNIVASQPGQGYGFFTSLFLGHTLGGPMATFATLAKTLGDPEKLAAIEKVSNATTDIVGRASKALFDVAGEQSGHISSVIREKAPIKNMYSSLEDEPAEAQKKAFKANVENVQKLTDDPEKLVDTLHEYTKDASTVAPNTMDAMRLGAIKAAMFLKDKIPQPPTPPLPYDKPYEPPFQDQKKFNRYYEAITNPLGILHQLSQNNLQPETKEAVQTVFPSLYGDMQTEILSHVAARGAKMIPYARRMALGKFIGQPLESSMTPSSIQAVQSVSNAAAAKQQAQQQIKPTAKGLEHLSVAQRGATLFQQTSLNKES